MRKQSIYEHFVCAFIVKNMKIEKEIGEMKAEKEIGVEINVFEPL